MHRQAEPRRAIRDTKMSRWACRDSEDDSDSSSDSTDTRREASCPRRRRKPGRHARFLGDPYVPNPVLGMPPQYMIGPPPMHMPPASPMAQPRAQPQARFHPPPAEQPIADRKSAASPADSASEPFGFPTLTTTSRDDIPGPFDLLPRGGWGHSRGGGPIARNPDHE
jgi:hypothetical protein